MANLTKVIYINEEDYSTLLNGETITKNGQTYSYDSGALYVIKDVSAPEYAETAGYAQNASRARYDYYGNDISLTYQEKSLIIEIDEDEEYVSSDDISNIEEAISSDKLIILKVTRNEDDDEVVYLYFSEDSSQVDGEYRFGNSNYCGKSYYAVIYGNKVFEFGSNDSNEHSHGKITYDGRLYDTYVTIANNDRLVITDASSSNKITESSILFDGSTTSQYLSKKGTWENTPAEIETGQIVGRLHRDDVSGSGQITIKNNSGQGFGTTGITTAGKYTVVIYSWSTTLSYGYNVSFGGNSYTISTTDGTISDKRILTVSAGALWTASVTSNIASGTTLIVEIYDANKMTPALSVGTVALTNLYDDLDGKPTIPSAPGTLNTNNTTAQTVSSSEALNGAIKLHKVSKTGSYNDLLNKPTLVLSDWDESDSTDMAYIQNKPEIPIINAANETYSSTAAVTSGNYCASIWRVDLSDKVSELYTGLTVLIKVPVAGNGSYGTLLRIDGTNSASDSSSNLYPVCANTNAMISTRYAVGCILALTFDADLVGQTLYYKSTSKSTSTANGTGWAKPGCWKLADYDSNTTTTYGTVDYYFRPYTGARLTPYKVVACDKDNRVIPITTEQYCGTYGSSTSYVVGDIVLYDGNYYRCITAGKGKTPSSSTSYWQAYTMPTQFTPTTTPFRPEKLRFYNTTTLLAAGAATGGQTLIEIGYSTAVCLYTFWASIPTYKVIYLQGTYNKTTGLFTLDSGADYYTLVPCNTANLTLSNYFTSGKYYILLGSTYSSANYFLLFMVNTMYYFDGTNLVPFETKLAEDLAPIKSISVNGTTLTITNGNVDLTISGGSLPNDYEMESSDTNEDLALEPGDTYDRAFAKIEKSISDNSYVVAAALNDLNLRVTSNTANIATKQDTLVSGTNIKTVNNLSLLGSGNIDVGGGAQADWLESDESSDSYIKNKPTIDLEEDSSDDTVTITLGDKTATVAKIEALEKNELVISAAFNDLNTRINNKQDELVSGTNIKTVNNQSLLGSGNIEIQGGSNVLADWDESDSTDDAYIKNKPVLSTITINGSTIGNYKYVTLVPNGDTSAGVPVLVSGAIYENNPGYELAPYTVPSWMAMSSAFAQINDMSGTIAGVSSAIANVSSAIASMSISGGITSISAGRIDDAFIISGSNVGIYGSGAINVAMVRNDILEISLGSIQTVLRSGDIVIDSGGVLVDDEILLTAAATDALYHNVQADWDESDESNDSFIRNKPTVIETVKVNGTALTPDANKAVNIDLSGYDKAPLIIEVGDSVNTVPAGTYASITTALSNGRKVFVKVYTDQGEGNINYHILPLVEKYYVEDDEDSYYFSASEYSNAFIATVFNNDDFGYSVTDLAQAHHNHGNIQWDGSLQFGDITVANGDKLVVTDASDNSSVARTSIAFDASTTTKALTQKGTWETFYQKPSTGIPSNDLASAVLTSLGLADTALLSYTETDPIFSASTAAGITSSDITNWNGKTSNVGTVTGVKINGTTNNPTSGVVDLGTVITSETSLSKGSTSGSGNAVTDISVNGHQITLTKDSTFLTSETLLSKGTTSGSGNAVTDISVSNHQITLTKGSTFLTAHLDIKTINSTSLVGTGNVTINELPSVTSSDNGKILMVVNGAWSLVTPTAIYSGSGTPSNNSGNNGDLYLQTS